jgi:hypothetical protein
MLIVTGRLFDTIPGPEQSWGKMEQFEKYARWPN